MQKKTKIEEIYNVDARELNKFISSNMVDVTITSPPYFDLKDYGYKEQIGYGQSYSDYLNDLKIVFKNVHDCTKETGTLWVIIDSFRRENEVVPLPFDFSNALKEVGWKLQEVIIWAKDRTVPWAHKGQMRNLFEYILLFSKSDNYHFFIDEVRDFSSLKKWWVKYPERYNPKGKIPDGLWHFEIPTQGSWGNGYIKHFCPLPEEMIAQILKISTKEGDVILDPFAGSGAVLAKAANMNRNYIGFELNQSYIKMFKNFLEKTGKTKRNLYLKQKSLVSSQNDFEKLIIDLRALKFAKILYKNFTVDVEKIWVEKKKMKATKKNALCIMEYSFYVKKKLNRNEFIKKLQDISNKAPLSKYGIEASFNIHTDADEFKRSVGLKKKIFSYTEKNTHQFERALITDEIFNAAENEIIFSSIKVSIDEKDYE